MAKKSMTNKELRTSKKSVVFTSGNIPGDSLSSSIFDDKEDEPINEKGKNSKGLTDLVGAKDNEPLFGFDDNEAESSSSWSPKNNSDKVDEQATTETASKNESTKQKPIDDDGEKLNKKEKSKKRPKQSKKQSQILLSIGSISSSSISQSQNDLKEDIKQVKSVENMSALPALSKESMSASTEQSVDSSDVTKEKESKPDQMEEEYSHKPRKTSHVRELKEVKRGLKKTDRSSELLRPKKDNHQKLNDVESDDAKLGKIDEESQEKTEENNNPYVNALSRKLIKNREKRKEIQENGYLVSSNCKIYSHQNLVKAGIFSKDLVIDNNNFYTSRRLWYYFTQINEDLISITSKYGLRFGCIRPPLVAQPQVVSLAKLSKILKKNWNRPTIWELSTSETLITTVNLNLFVMFLKKIF